MSAHVNEIAQEQVAAAVPGNIEGDDERDEYHEIDDITEYARAANV
jgi:hypothetical protein